MEANGRQVSTASISPDIFREYDIRGVAGEELTPEVARLVARAFAGWLEERGGTGGPRGARAAESKGAADAAVPKVALLGRDNRLSSPGLAAGAARGFREAGWDVVDIGVAPTPVFYWAGVRRGPGCGIMVTGSHNEARYNGMKLQAGPGTLYGEDIQEVGRRAAAVAAGEARAASGAPAGAGPSRELQVLDDYLDDLLGRIAPARRLRVAIDCGNGTAGLVAPRLFERLGCEVLPLYAELDGTFPGHWPDPVVPKNLARLQEVVRDSRADVGLAFDGDADRLGVVDDRGEILWGDVLMILFWREILARRPGAEAIVEVKCSQGLVDEIRRLGGNPVFHATGHSLIKATMRRTGAPFAGEMSGHLFFADEYYGFDDALYAAARLVRIVAGQDRPLSGLLADRPRYFATPEIRLECPDQVKFQLVERVRRLLEEQGVDVVAVDGARANYPGRGWLLVRASNTQPALVIRCEGRSREELAWLCSEAARVLRQAAKEVGLKDLDTGELGA